MERGEVKFPENPHRKTNNLIFYAQIGLRIMAVSTAFALTWTIVTAKQMLMVFGMQFDARHEIVAFGRSARVNGGDGE
ncbi:hypothetical protein V6N13_104586 [Hibiscus sabdariffa]|uniref:Uncharacterized protein n=2 Tax=Hibiscus sabdariffa TaxID=183260 RepID=A0ABR2DD52_9ROSI